MADAALAMIPELLAATVARVGDQPALGLIHDGHLVWLSWNEIDANVRQFAQRLQQVGIRPGDRVAQYAPNSAAWIVTDLAILSLGAVHVPLHASLAKPQAEELLRLADAKLLVVAEEHMSPAEVLTLRFAESDIERSPGLSELSTLHLDGPEDRPARSRIAPAQLATLLFTSGTTGQPRGVMLSHENLVSNAIATTEVVGSLTNETRLCFLPLSHIYARTCDLYSWLYRGSRLVLAENRETIVRDCQIARPQAINGVPYFYQKIAQQLRGAEPGALKRLLGGELVRCFCGGAPVAPEVETFFEQQGLPLLSGYGLTEASPVVSATAPDDYQPGTVGQPLANLEVKLSAEGEVQVRGSSVMQGYWQDSAATQQTLIDGWLHTGDLGEFDSKGHLRIVGRKKEIIVLATGKNVSPTRVERLLAGSVLVEHVCVLGDGRKCLGALIVPNPDALRREIREQRLWVWSRRRAVTHPKILQVFRREIDRLLLDSSAEEQIGYFAILPRNFSMEQGELTAKLSLRRAVIIQNFTGVIERMYER